MPAASLAFAAVAASAPSVRIYIRWEMNLSLAWHNAVVHRLAAGREPHSAYGETVCLQSVEHYASVLCEPLLNALYKLLVHSSVSQKGQCPTLFFSGRCLLVCSACCSHQTCPPSNSGGNVHPAVSGLQLP